ncbi:Endoplasmic Reticulum Oxidoreductin 1 (ERO1) [Nakaseomyces glabratus]|nr:Endoplasmic Reticulum Oxidoreductin 1 (ERO1) [Nakaseomyces glabratus]KAH7600907.1 Endoplasmic Reticulum Oxidoreductin 1 (ERO1) [Nakaseomyces glabratus]KAH7613346.1 Endoplasmic Reticulum Oxidoreductin 1 (ERO1) [Nakaseomyces glabratus]
MKLSYLLLAGIVAGEGNSTNNQTNWTTENHFCAMDKDLMISPSCNVTFTELNVINKSIRKNLVSLVRTDFFKYFKIDPDKQCTFWDNNDGLCFSRDCMVDVVTDWDSLPEIWQPEVLGGLDEAQDASGSDEKEWTFLDDLCAESQQQSKPKPLLDVDDNNYCDINDFSGENAVLVDLTKNPERFTGYGGQQSSQIWTSIYGENCSPLGKDLVKSGKASQDEVSMARDVFFRFVSGLHASIGTHLSNDHLNTENGKWEPNLDLFMLRVGNFPDRVTNIYFNYAVIAKSLWKIKPYLSRIEFCNDYDDPVKSKILSIVSKLDSSIFNEDLLFQNDLSSSLKNEFRARFKNVTKIMDCVHCDRCKLWGKVQTTGMATSLKILFDLDEADESSKQKFVDKLTKYELIALFNTFDKLSESVEYINNFEKLYKRREGGDSYTNFFQNNFFKILEKMKKGWSTINDSVSNNKEYNNSVQNSESISDPSEESMTSLVKDAVEEVKNSTKSSLSDNDEFITAKLSENNENIEENKLEDKLNEQEAFADLKMPIRKKKLTKKKSNGTLDIWINAWHTETHNVMEAIKFILRSYIDLPRNLWRLTIVTVNKLWNNFVGVANYVSEEPGEEIIYDLDFQ